VTREPPTALESQILGSHRQSKAKFVANNCTSPNTNPKALTTLNLTLNDPHDA